MPQALKVPCLIQFWNWEMAHSSLLTLWGNKNLSFKGVAVRNPATNRPTKAAATDIPDIESNYADLSYDYLPLKTDAMRKLYEISPIALVENIKAPVCLFLGKRDRRVPPSQGREFYHALKALGRKVRMYEYEDNHSLAKVTTAAKYIDTTQVAPSGAKNSRQEDPWRFRKA